MERFTGLLGLLVILAVAFLVSRSRRSIQPRVIAWGLGLQFSFAFLVLKTDVGQLFQFASVAVNALLDYAERGSEFLFGPLGVKSGPYGVIFAFQVLPIVSSSPASSRCCTSWELCSGLCAAWRW